MSRGAIAEDLSRDCPLCRSAGTVAGRRCQLCDAELPPRSALRPAEGGAADLPPAVPPTPPLRLADVIGELRAIAQMAADAGSPERLAEACARVEDLLLSLRRQFLAEVVVGRPAPAPARGA